MLTFNLVLTFRGWIHEPLGLELHAEVERAIDAAGEAAEGDEGHDDLDGDGDQEPREAGEEACPHTGPPGDLVTSPRGPRCHLVTNQSSVLSVSANQRPALPGDQCGQCSTDRRHAAPPLCTHQWPAAP